MATLASPSVGTSVRAASAALLDSTARSVSLERMGSQALIFYRPDDRECARRMSTSAGRLDNIGVLQTLLELPVGLPVERTTLPQRLQAGIRRLPVGAADLDRSQVVRRAVRPLAVDLAVVRAATAGWRDGLRRASRFAPFCRRALFLDAFPAAREDLLMEAAFYGVGVLVRTGTEGTVMALEPRLYRPQRHTPAAWCFTEEIHQQLA
ncbi:hypothetical protein [Streptomyces sp. AM8-1-1]|uniref:hypothetical protein n=1 Tax=Streptomyces sp. AM8-1-1 TaxID=3075825 RepID=UPI0028C4171F|nr:hypothetical protein [Streptomyces sp. AM8-1-1]WNO70158.1 hypothetical protein RPQ07_00220 [Streptomyces sp. AM8-1-1]WNO76958.1 hypothetical protein RPQ07_37505 [Streptomyces sp. AM8-1-1]